MNFHYTLIIVANIYAAAGLIMANKKSSRIIAGIAAIVFLTAYIFIK